MQMTLKALRANKNLTQAEAAQLVGVSKETWANYEKQKSFPSVPVIKSIEKAFHVNYDDIIFLT